MVGRKPRWHGLGCFVLVLLAACSHVPRSMVSDSALPMGHWEGRLSMQVANHPPEQFSSAFEMTGHSKQGELTLLSPLGTTMAVVRWNPQGASLQQGANTQQFDSMDALTQRLTGAPLPLPALLTWLDGAGPPVAGWKISAQAMKSGRRVLAERQQPLPGLQLTLLLAPSS
jgi:outer membrane lipoprotein LolB